MTTTLRTATARRTTATKRAPMDKMRKTALIAGVFYLITFISIPTLALYSPVKNHRDWILTSGPHTGVLVGGFLEVIVALAGIGTAITLYPVVKRQNEGGQGGWHDSWLAAIYEVIAIASVLVAGLYVSTRRAYLAELRDRAQRLERERDQTSALAAAVERARIAREMHDSVAHHLTVIVALSDGALAAVTRPLPRPPTRSGACRAPPGRPSQKPAA